MHKQTGMKTNFYLLLLQTEVHLDIATRKLKKNPAQFNGEGRSSYLPLG